jgi:hypothetical protein
MSTGGCPAGCKDCKTKVLKCNCGNDTRLCNSCEGNFKPPPKPKPTDEPPGPTKPPVPTEPPVTPTPVQPTIIATVALPPPDTNTTKKNDDKKAILGKSRICIESIPCSQTGAPCSAWGDKKHRVLIRTKEGTRLILANQPTYVLECLSPDQKSYQCTTGNDTLDKALLDIKNSNVTNLKNDYGYEFVSYTTQNNEVIDQSNPTKVRKTDPEGKFGPYEWESKTTKNAWRYIITIQDLDSSQNDQGSMGALQQGTAIFSSDNYNKYCVIINWDPRGIVYDADTLKPIENVKTTLYVKNEKGAFEIMKDKKWGILSNPTTTSKNGNYQFFVPAGTYQLKVEKKGYEFIVKQNSSIKNIYDGKEIVTQGEVKEVNIFMKRKSLLPYLFDMVSLLFSHE